MAKPTVADYLLERLRAWDVTEVFAYPGDGINGILAAWGRAANKPTFIQARHEEMAAFEAVGYAKFTGKFGVCMATSGPGAIHLLNGLYDAKLDHVPVVAIVGQTSRSAMGGSYQQEVDLLSLFKDVASEYVQMVTVPEQLPGVLDRAIRVALAERAPTAIIIPSDVQELVYSAPTHAFKMVPSSLGIDWPTAVPNGDALARAAEILNAGRKVAILAGQGARGARAELEQVAEILGAGVAKPLLGKDVLSDELPYVTGSIGLLGTRPSYELMEGCDTLLTVGSSFPYTQFLPAFDQARAVQIDIDGKYVGMRYPYELNLVGDARATLQALIPLLERKEDRSWREDIEAKVTRWWETMEQEAMVEADPVNPMRLFHELSTRLPDNAIVTADSGSSANWYARQLKFHGDIRGSLSGNLATMGPGVPYGIGAKFGHPDRPVIVFAGDGAMQMNGLAELITIKHYWEQWADPRLIVAVLHNDDLNQVTWEMRAMEGAPKFTESQTLPDVDYAAFATSLGLQGINVDKPGDLAPAWERALTADRPTVLDVRVDPNIPPIPPHATFEQAKDTAKAILKGDENARSIIVEGIKTKVQEFLPHSNDLDVARIGVICGVPARLIQTARERSADLAVGAGNGVTPCDLGVFVDQSAEVLQAQNAANRFFGRCICACGRHRSRTHPVRADLAGIPGSPGENHPRRRLLPCGHRAALPPVRAVLHRAQHPPRVRGRDYRPPDGEWVTQQARNLLMNLDHHAGGLKFLIRDRDTKFTAALDAIFTAAGMRIIKTPVRAPRANAIAERWIASARRECLDRVLITGERHLRLVLTEYTDHYNAHRPHRVLQQSPPAGRPYTPALGAHARVLRRDRLGGLIHEYAQVA